MSWAEIKKSVNSDLNLPLNELLRREFFVDGENILESTLSHGTTSNTTLTKVLEVSGKGKIHYINTYIKSDGSAPCEFVLYIDGSVAIDATHLNTANALLRFKAATDFGMVSSTTASNMTEYYLPPTNANQFFSLRLPVVFSGTTTTQQFIIYSMGKAEFKNEFSIWMKTQDTNQDTFIQYELYE